MRAIIVSLFLCFVFHSRAQQPKVRMPVDTIGFAWKPWQMDSIITRIHKLQKEDLTKPVYSNIKVAICPHDDYSYTGYMYLLSLRNIKAKTIILFGVAHKAKKLGLENKIIFDSYSHWRSAYGDVKVSALREQITSGLKTNLFEVNDTMQKIEHSVEAIIPFLQYQNKEVEIIPILVPAMSFERMDSVSNNLAGVLKIIMEKNNLKWGEDISIVISNDAVHYGDEDWGGKYFARYGADTAGYIRALAFEKELIRKSLHGQLKKKKIRSFNNATVMKENFREYKWTWCGRYSVPFGLLTSLHLQKHTSKKNLKGKLLGYSTSISNPHIPVQDLHLGVTAPAKLRHWVGYASLIYLN